MKTNQEENQPKTIITDPLGSQKFKFAIFIFIVYLIFIGYLLWRTDTKDDLIWTRMLFLFTGIEAIVFAALGYVFGRDVHRKRAENAEKNAEDAKKDEAKAKKDAEEAKDKAQKEREKGIALSAAVKSRNSNTTHGNSRLNIKGLTGSANLKDTDDYLVNLANNLYPSPSDYLTISFDYEISSADNLNDVTINKNTKNSAKGTYSGIPIFDDRFTVHVDRKDDKKDWTIKVTRIWDSNGNERKQLNGKTDSNYDSAYVQLENL
ncbi:hypothetical protein [Changchengzhania lutea]|uniref:hypothetical protein n=1 Tax=Changchengzhania lutea TaxID=2049305 RepID=UPI00115CFCBA|nr:hypothetical protein [Changchengzhania lutea]